MRAIKLAANAFTAAAGAALSARARAMAEQYRQPALAADDDQERKGRLLLLGKGASWRTARR